ncbi:MAG TPA: AAA family ATPase, partial [Planctomycetales bacterium]|nr:AAA family ATPase [Planctomycetales bacterium]
MKSTASLGAVPGARASLDEADLRAAERLTKVYEKMTQQLGRVIIGQNEVLKQVLIALFCQGHCILEGVPGLAKTLMISSIAQLLSLTFKRIQFTPDLMPSDITGTEILEEEEGTGRRRMRFVKGPLFGNIILGDEINRTPPKTQAALLQAMQEFKVTTAGTDFPLEKPFLVLGTQNPIEQEGT